MPREEETAFQGSVYVRVRAHSRDLEVTTQVSHRELAVSLVSSASHRPLPRWKKRFLLFLFSATHETSVGERGDISERPIYYHLAKASLRHRSRSGHASNKRPQKCSQTKKYSRIRREKEELVIASSLESKTYLPRGFLTLENSEAARGKI